MSAFDTMAVLFPHEAETCGITVRVAVSYLSEQSAPASGRWFWSYHIRIENGRPAAVQLLARHWVITDALGQVHEVRGQGVVGDTPRIEPGGSYDYVSGCPLETSSGVMAGVFQMIDDQGAAFEIRISAFALLGPDA